jgi:hypothetical protein
MDDDIEFDETFRTLPGVDLSLWLSIALGLIVAALLVGIAVWAV